MSLNCDQSLFLSKRVNNVEMCIIQEIRESKKMYLIIKKTMEYQEYKQKQCMLSFEEELARIMDKGIKISCMHRKPKIEQNISWRLFISNT